MLKKALSLLLGVMLLMSVTLVSAVTFSDMTSQYSWAEEAVTALSEDGIINGYPDGTFKPGNNITKEEAISLFARTLGSEETLNSSVVSLANVLYEEDLENYNTYAKESAAYLLYKKVLSVDELATYLSAANKGESLKRYEAATLIAKCLGGDVWLKSNPDVTLTFADAADVPASAKGYVYFASEAQIMQGMENNMFVPMGDVTRAQIATMIYRIITRMDYTYSQGVISQLDATTNTVTLRDEQGLSESYVVNKNVAVMLDGEQSQITLLEVGQEVIITFSNGALYSLDVVEMAVDATFQAVYKGKSTNSSATTLKFTTLDTEDTLSYKLADNVVISYNGVAGTLGDLQVGDYMDISIKSGKISAIVAETKTTKIEGARVENITYEPDVLITVRTAENELLSYGVKAGATIRKNSAITTFSDLAIGDKVDLTLEYGEISSVTAIGVEKKITGQIEEIKISKTNSSLTINNGSATTVYNVSRDVEITLDEEAATLYDLRIGFSVELITSSSTITEVKVKSVASPMQITGEIVLVNKTYGMLRIAYADANGNMSDATVFVKANAKILDSNDGKIKTIDYLKAGQNITVACAENVGVFEATSIMILSNTQ